MMKCLRFDKERDLKDDKSTIFLINGSRLLEKMITFCNGKCSIPIKSFTAEELEKATNNFNEKQVPKIDGYFELYKGFLQDRPVIVKKFIIKQAHQFSINEIVYASGMSVHKNVLKLLGCCLETHCPTLVFECAEEKTLADRIIDRDDMHFQPVPWNVRLKTAIDIANVVVYMHTAFPRPIVHRNIKASNVLLDRNSVAKLSDFSLCVSIPEGETYVEDIVAGTVGVIAPESLATGYFNEKNDVYSFGVLLLVLLTGQRSFDNTRVETGDEFLLVNHVKKYLRMNRFKEMFDPFILGEAVKEQQLESVGALAIKCIDDSAEKRPEMIEVAKELIRIYRSAIDPC
ncbi:serine/threonine-protein kinase ZRK1-like [Euphorbia lathyris]|uniref:serine/threonine-protein kinase ZRK1-like n=1 Tax=Euphorbia lathyris TaxID=212925 RepID=UPI0033142F6F